MLNHPERHHPGTMLSSVTYVSEGIHALEAVPKLKLFGPIGILVWNFLFEFLTNSFLSFKFEFQLNYRSFHQFELLLFIRVILFETRNDRSGS